MTHRMVDELVGRLAYESNFSRRRFIAAVGVRAATARLPIHSSPLN